MPFFKPLPGQKALKNARAKMSDIGHELLLDGKAAVKAAGGDKDFSSRRDLFSLLLKANMAADVPGKSRLSDEEVIARKSLFEFHSANIQGGSEIPTFFVAGHETTRCVRSQRQFLRLILHQYRYYVGIVRTLQEPIRTKQASRGAYDSID
jgi:hypothetical protein